jgi:hypothetical protein
MTRIEGLNVSLATILGDEGVVVVIVTKRWLHLNVGAVGRFLCVRDGDLKFYLVGPFVDATEGRPYEADDGGSITDDDTDRTCAFGALSVSDYQFCVEHTVLFVRVSRSGIG